MKNIFNNYYKTLLSEVDKQPRNVFSKTDSSSWKYKNEMKKGGSPVLVEPATEDEPALGGITHTALRIQLVMAYNSKDKASFLIWGEPGIGKSAAVKDAGKEIAESLNKTYVEFHKLPTHKTENEISQDDILTDPTSYFCFIDVRAAALEPADFMGIPIISGDDSPSLEDVHNKATPKEKKILNLLRTVKFRWAALATDPRTTGIVFFDEINQADMQVMKAFYSVISSHDRFLFDTALSSNILVIGAGNLRTQDDTAQNKALPTALQRRFGSGRATLVVDANDWLEWAQKGHSMYTQKGAQKLPVHPIIISFMLSDPANNFWNGSSKNTGLFSNGMHDRNPDPDSIVALSKQFYNIDINIYNILNNNNHINPGEITDKYLQFAYSIVGKLWADRFAKFLTTFSKQHSTADQYAKFNKQSAHAKWSMLGQLAYRINELVARDADLNTPGGKTAMYEISECINNVDAEYKQTLTNFIDTNDTFKHASMKFKHEIGDKFKYDPKDTKNKWNDSIINGFRGDTKEVSTYQKGTDVINVPIVTHATLPSYLNAAYETKEPFLVYGGIGEGKSVAVREFCEAKASVTPKKDNPKEARQFVSIMKLTRDEQIKIMQNPGDYFMLIDVRLAGLTHTDFVGVPSIADLRNSKWLNTKKLPWVIAASTKNAVGVLFFDEMNQADPHVLKTMYSIMHSDDRFIFDIKISDGIAIFAAGNLQSHDPNAEIEPLQKALTRRFKAGSAVLEVTGNEWLSWAKNNNIHNLILWFIAKEPDPSKLIRLESPDPEKPDCNPDALTQLSAKLYQIEDEYGKRIKRGEKLSSDWLENMYVQAATYIIHTDFARQFSVFVNHFINYDYDEVVSNPERFKDVGGEGEGLADFFGQLIFLCTKLQEVYVEDPRLKNPENKANTEKFLHVFINMYHESRSLFFTQFRILYPKLTDGFITFLFTSNYSDPTLKDKIKLIIQQATEFAIKAQSVVQTQ